MDKKKKVNRESDIKVVYMNTQSARNKFGNLECLAVSEGCDILILVETWFNREECHLFNIENYTAAHKCRNGRGGGVSIYVKSHIKICEIGRSLDEETIDWICVNIGEAVAEELNHDVKNLGISGDSDEILCGNMVTMLDLTNKDEINKIFHELKKNSAPGNNEVSVRDVINLKNFLVEPIVSLINHAFTTGIFPKELKMSVGNAFLSTQQPELSFMLITLVVAGCIVPPRLLFRGHPQ
ncbi:hypothetical protein WA026_022117 [Henosepilachna vigintioctopunctata]|uniref:Uncharacterized protein n=1 Tax=Henosepilachna vigintioctopunctata TaxID=420089 RepID=A0AAW1UC07_9CUCU